MITKNDLFKWFIRAILAGMAIAMGGIVFIQTTIACGPEFKWVGAILFAIGLYTVLTYGLNLYTGKVGYILDNDRKFLVEVLVTIIGNLVGSIIVGYFFQFDYAIGLVEGKLAVMDASYATVIAKAFMCGILMYIAVDAYKSKGSYLATFVCVPVFILAGFEHSIANMFYISSAMMWNVDTIIFTLLGLFGNMLGCCLIPAYRKWVDDKPKAETQ